MDWVRRKHHEKHFFSGFGHRPFSLTILSTNAFGCEEGCTPGYWKQPQHLDSWCAEYNPDDDFESVFGVDASFTVTLLEALKQGGGGEKALARHAVAALLNGCYGLEYYSPSQVMDMVQDAYSSTDFESAKNIFEWGNELGCPLN